MALQVVDHLLCPGQQIAGRNRGAGRRIAPDLALGQDRTHPGDHGGIDITGQQPFCQRALGQAGHGAPQPGAEVLGQDAAGGLLSRLRLLRGHTQRLAGLPGRPLAAQRRCVHLYIDYPARDTEIAIVRLKIPDIEEKLCATLVDAIRKIRTLDLKKSPSISETLDWAQSLLALQIHELSPEVVSETLNVICKYQSDLEKVRKNIDRVVI